MFSDYGDIESAVPQGSILGPLLFLVHINAITDNIQSCTMLFADDTYLCITVDNNDIEATEQLNNDKTVNELVKKW